MTQRRLSRPLADLAAQVERFDPHTPPVPVAEGGHVEIAALSRGFNRMSARVAAMERNRAVMLAGVSHDVRTPLAKLRLAVAMLADRDDAQGQTAHRQVVEIDRVLGQFLEFARGGEGEKPVPTDLAALVRGITEAHAAEGETIAFEAMQGEPVMVRPESMRRAVENLLQNAMKYGRSPISLGLDVTSGWAEIAVRDRGPGVAHDALPSLHDPFTRADTARDGPAGTGLGLAIAHQIVSVHGGTLGLGNLDPIGRGRGIFRISLGASARADLRLMDDAQKAGKVSEGDPPAMIPEPAFDV